MLPQTSAPEKSSDRHRSWMSCCETLESLAHALRSYGLHATLIPDQGTPYVRVHLSGTAGARADLVCHGSYFDWDSLTGTHTTADPDGCARRIATQLRHEQRPGGR